MPWWSWLLIWSALALALLTTVALFGVALFRKLMTLVDALAELGATVGAAGTQADDGVAPARAIPAVFHSPGRFAEVVADRRFDRLHRRQLRRDRAIDRGKLLGTMPVIPKDSTHA